MRHASGLCAVALAFVVGAGGSAAAKDDVGDLVNGLHGTDDAAARIALVKRLGMSRSERGADVLCKTAQRDADPRVRIAAAEALVAIDADVAYPALKELLTEGGIREVRRQAAIGMAARPNGLQWTVDRICSGRTDKVERVLLVSALGDFPGLAAAEALEQFVAWGPPKAGTPARPLSGSAEAMHLIGRSNPPLRSVALRALARHPLGRMELPRIAVEVLQDADDAETILAALDVCDGVLDREIRGVLPALMARGDRRITAAAACVSRRLDYLDALDRYDRKKKDAEKARKEGYAPFDPTTDAPPAPTGPLVRPKVDVVYVCDASASAAGCGKVKGVRGIGLASDEEADPNVSYRHGFVSMQDTMRDAWDPPSIYFPPVFDSSELRDVKWRQPSIGVDTEGMEVGVVLREVLDTFEWRPGAARRIVVGSDTYVGDPELAQRTVRVHRAADGLTLECPYFGFVIGKNEQSWRDLLAAAGVAPPPPLRKK